MEWLNPQPPQGVVTRGIRGFPLRLTYDPQTYVGRFLYYRGMYEETNIRVLRRVLRPGMTFLDIGANVGLYTTVGASLVGPSGRVVAVEPQGAFCDLVRANVAQNGLTNVTVVHAALGREEGTGTLHQVYDDNPSAATLRLQAGERSQSSVTVPIRTLGDVLDGALPPDGALVVKMDVEGAELEILEGASDYFRAHPALLMFVECNDQHLRRFGVTSRDLVGKLHAMGFRVSSLRRGRRVDHGPETDTLNADVIAWRAEHTPW